MAETTTIAEVLHRTIIQTVNQASTATNIISSSNPSIYGQSVTFTATVNPIPDGGTVQFADNGTNLGSPVRTNTSSGQATYSTSILSVGSYSISANYSGNSNFAASTGTLSQIVNPTPSTPVSSGGSGGGGGGGIVITPTPIPTTPVSGTGHVIWTPTYNGVVSASITVISQDGINTGKYTARNQALDGQGYPLNTITCSPPERHQHLYLQTGVSLRFMI